MMEAIHALDAWTNPFFSAMGMWSLMTILYGGMGLIILSPLLLAIYFWRRSKRKWYKDWGKPNQSVPINEEPDIVKSRWAIYLIFIGFLWIEHSVTIFTLLVVVGLFAMLSLNQGGVKFRSVLAIFAIFIVQLKWIVVTGTQFFG